MRAVSQEMLKIKPWIELEIMKYKLTAYLTESMTWCIVLQPRCYSMQLSTRPIKLMISHFVYCTTHSLLSWCSGDIILLLHMMQSVDVYCPAYHAYAVLHQRVYYSRKGTMCLAQDYRVICTLTHWGRDKMAAILQTKFWNAYLE